MAIHLMFLMGAIRRAAILASVGASCFAIQTIDIRGAVAADRAVIEAGLQLYKGMSACEVCHGWMATGGAPNDTPGFEPGPSFVETKLTRAQVIELLSCGTPGGRMPTYLANAWTEQRPCYGKTTIADIPIDQRPPRPISALPQDSIETLATLIEEFFQGKRMTLERCFIYNGEKSPLCELFR